MIKYDQRRSMWSKPKSSLNTLLTSNAILLSDEFCFCNMNCTYLVYYSSHINAAWMRVNNEISSNSNRNRNLNHNFFCELIGRKEWINFVLCETNFYPKQKKKQKNYNKIIGIPKMKRVSFILFIHKYPNNDDILA